MTSNILKGIKDELHGVFSGIALSTVISVVSQVLARKFPMLGAALIAIFFGIFAGNTIFSGKKYDSGTKFSEKRLLEYSIVLNGLIIDMAVMMTAGLRGILFIVINMVLTIVIAYYISRAFKFGKKFSLLMGAGNAVCGSSAIGTVSPIIGADSKDKGISITCVNITGTILMVSLPVIAGIIYHSATLPSSALIGGTVQSIGQVIASAKLMNDSVVELSTVFKLIRVMLIVAIALAFERLNTTDGEPLFKKTKKDLLTAKEDTENGQKKKIKLNIPWFIYGFILLFILRSTFTLPDTFIVASKTISTQFEIIALAAIGVRVKFADIIKEGPKALTCSVLTGVIQVLLAIALIEIMGFSA